MKKNKHSVHFTVLTLFPDLIQNYLKDALLSKAVRDGLIQVNVIALRPFADSNYKAIDDVPYGGGDGMVFKASVLEAALKSFAQKNARSKKIIYLSPQGKTFDHLYAKKLASECATVEAAADDLANGVSDGIEIILICGRYAGIDQRFIQRYVDEEISIGDYVLSGGELGALVLIESISRYVPGVLGDELSARMDSFEDRGLEAPQFTKPQNWSDLSVPEVLASGNHQKIKEWKAKVGALVTLRKRPDLFFAQFQKSEMKAFAAFYNELSDDDRKVLQLENLDMGELK